jgi:hydroxyacylglutathione hydrolase
MQLARDLSLIGLENIAGVFPIESLDPANTNEITPAKSVDDAASSNDATILDVRGRSEYASGHIHDALNSPLNELQRRLDEIPEGKVIVHCQGGGRSAIAASILLQSGRDDVANMTGGFSEWERTGRHVERDGPHE